MAGSHKQMQNSKPLKLVPADTARFLRKNLSVGHESWSCGLGVKLIDEMVDLRVQQHTIAALKLNPELAKILAQKRETDRHRLEEVRAELIQLLNE